MQAPKFQEEEEVDFNYLHYHGPAIPNCIYYWNVAALIQYTQKDHGKIFVLKGKELKDFLL